MSQVNSLLLRRLNVPLEEIHTVTDQIWKGETEMLFDSFEGYDIQEVRKTSREEGEIGIIRKMLGKGCTAEQIADLLDMDEAYILQIAKLHD